MYNSLPLLAGESLSSTEHITFLFLSQNDSREGKISGWQLDMQLELILAIQVVWDEL